MKTSLYLRDTVGTFEKIKNLETFTISVHLTILEGHDKYNIISNKYTDKYQFKQLVNLTTIDYE